MISKFHFSHLIRGHRIKVLRSEMGLDYLETVCCLTCNTHQSKLKSDFDGTL